MKGSIKKKSKTRVKYLKSVEEIPDFKSEEEEIEFWKSHSMVDILDKLPEVKVEISGELKKRIEEHQNKKLLTLRLDPAQIEKAKQIAIKKGMGYLTLMRNWIQEGIEIELSPKDDIRKIIEILDNLSGFQDRINRITRLIDDLENSTTYIIRDITHSNVYYTIEREQLGSIPIPRPSKNLTNPARLMYKRDNPMIIQ